MSEMNQFIYVKLSFCINILERKSNLKDDVLNIIFHVI